MKISNKKIIVSTLALAMGAALAGSISGSVAWYQYSTRAAAQIAGVSAGTLGKLEVKQVLEGDTDTFAQTKVIAAQNFKPQSIVKETSGALTFLDHPVYQVAQLPTVKSGEEGYVDYTFAFRFQQATDKTSGGEPSWADASTRNIYLSHFDIVKASGVAAADDVSPAVRVAFLDSSDKPVYILAPFGTDGSAVTTATKGNLDLNKNSKDDTMLWDCTDSDGESDASKKIVYTNGADSYTTDAHSSVVLSQSELSDHVYDLDSTASIAAKKVATTATNLKMRVWIEGWALLNSDADWTANYLKQNFEIQIQFACQADK